jgi:hypothetical protein
MIDCLLSELNFSICGFHQHISQSASASSLELYGSEVKNVTTTINQVKHQKKASKSTKGDKIVIIR